MIVLIIEIIGYSVFALLLAAGLFSLVTSFVPVPAMGAVSAVRSLAPRTGNFNLSYVFPVARFFERFIHINPYNRRAIEKQLRAANLDYTPEFYFATCAANALLFVIPAVIMLPVFAPLSIPFIIAAVVMFFVTKNSVVSSAIKRHDRLETKIPKLTESIVNSLTYRQDPETMIRNYRKVSGEEFGKELDILLTNMRTSPKGRIYAYLEFQRRMNSPMATRLVQGLIGIERGDDMAEFLRNELVHMKDKRTADLHIKGEKRGGELNTPNLLLIGALIVLALTVILSQTMSSVQIFF